MQHAALRKVSVWPKAQAKHYNVGGNNVGGLRSILSIGSLQKFCPAPQHQFKRIVDDNDSTSSKDTHAMQRCGGGHEARLGPSLDRTRSQCLACLAMAGPVFGGATIEVWGVCKPSSSEYVDWNHGDCKRLHLL